MDQTLAIRVLSILCYFRVRIIFMARYDRQAGSFSGRSEDCNESSNTRIL